MNTVDPFLFEVQENSQRIQLVLVGQRKSYDNVNIRHTCSSVVVKTVLWWAFIILFIIYSEKCFMITITIYCDKF